MKPGIDGDGPQHRIVGRSEAGPDSSVPLLLPSRTCEFESSKVYDSDAPNSHCGVEGGNAVGVGVDAMTFGL
jgi:hypothetical protein